MRPRRRAASDVVATEGGNDGCSCGARRASLAMPSARVDGRRVVAEEVTRRFGRAMRPSTRSQRLAPASRTASSSLSWGVRLGKSTLLHILAGSTGYLGRVHRRHRSLRALDRERRSCAGARSGS
jgi:hypothetical protein